MASAWCSSVVLLLQVGGRRAPLVFGNPFCFDDVSYGFESCCSEDINSEGCWDGGAFNYNSCCFTGPINYHIENGFAQARFVHVAVTRTGKTGYVPLHQWWGWGQVFRGLWLLELDFGISSCAQRAKQLDWNPWPEANQDHSRAKSCTSIDGINYTLTLTVEPLERTDARTYSRDSAVTSKDLSFCAPASCSLVDVLTDLAPRSIMATPRLLKMLGNSFVLHEVSTYIPAQSHKHQLGTTVPRGTPCSRASQEEYRRLLYRCGRCELRRYGDAHDGGYLMCALEAGTVVAAYSYGISDGDAWGDAVSLAAGTVVHQYDCTIASPPACRRLPCRAVFHKACLQAQAQAPESLAAHLRANGHADVLEGQLLLKLDVDGPEWSALGEADVLLLRTFRQIVVEFHRSLLGVFVDRTSLEARKAVLRKLLEVFVVVHVHANNACHPGSCLEVTFANRKFVELVECSPPLTHELDAVNAVDRPELDISSLFHQS